MSVYWIRKEYAEALCPAVRAVEGYSHAHTRLELLLFYYPSWIQFS